MSKVRLVFFTLLVTSGIGLTVVFGLRRLNQDAMPTLAPAFQLAGKSTELLDKSFTKVIPVGSLDEKQLGEAVAKRQHLLWQSDSTDAAVNDSSARAKTDSLAKVDGRAYRKADSLCTIYYRYQQQLDSIYKASWLASSDDTSRTKAEGKLHAALDSLDKKIIAASKADSLFHDRFYLILRRYEADSRVQDLENRRVTTAYLNELVTQQLSQYAKKPFAYEVFIDSWNVPNAFALPGGVIYVTSGLMRTVKSESELISILAHEMGHIELGHCFGAVKFELLAKKLNAAPLGQLVDFANALLLRHSFSKTQEGDADDYGYDLLLGTSYDPRGMGKAFANLKQSSGGREEKKNLDVMQDYFSTHPALDIRIEKFSAKANVWWSEHSGEQRYVGEQNLIERKSFYIEQKPAEWVSR
jgi:Zn-dependent protease with chaperone function